MLHQNLITMKTKYFIFSCLLLGSGISGWAQTQLNNSGFETWIQRNTGGFKYTDPDSWYTLNVLQQYGFDATTIQSSDAHSGNHAALLNSVSDPFGDIPGLLTVNNIIDVNGDPDLNLNFIAFKDRPSQVSFWFKSYPEIGDLSSMYCALTKWNSALGKRDTVAMASWEMDSTVSTYTKAIINFTYFSSANPDSLTMIFSSSQDGFNPTPGSELYIDDIQMSYANGLNEWVPQVNTSLYPNPAGNQVRLMSDVLIEKVCIKDELGRTLSTQSIGGTDELVNLAHLPEGIYFFELSFKDLEIRKTIKVLKVN